LKLVPFSPHPEVCGKVYLFILPYPDAALSAEVQRIPK